MVNFTYPELADMHLMYGRSNGNSREAKRLYAETFPNRRLPNKQTFVSIDRHLRENGTFQIRNVDAGRPRNVRIPIVEERVLRRVRAYPSTSLRRVARQEGISRHTVFNVLHDNHMHPYHVMRVQSLSVADYPARVTFCEWYLQKCALNNEFPNLVLFTDEAQFTRDGIFNFHNQHNWMEDNPHAIVQSRHQHQFSINVWAGIIGNELIGPHILPRRLTGNAYAYFLEHDLPRLLDVIPLETRDLMWLMHDGAPPHFSIVARQFLNRAYLHRWIGRAGPVPWPPRSPDLNPLDFYLWGHLKSLVYSTPVPDATTLQQRIFDCCQIIRNTPGILDNVMQSMLRRARACILMHGQHFEHLL